MSVLLDSSFVIDLIQRRGPAVARAEALAASGEPLYLPSPVIYEVMTGILYAKSRTQAEIFRAVASDAPTLDFDEHAATRAAEVKVELLRLGRRKGDADIMIAGMALAGGHRLLTRDKDFAGIAGAVGLVVEEYA